MYGASYVPFIMDELKFMTESVRLRDVSVCCLCVSCEYCVGAEYVCI